MTSTKLDIRWVGKNRIYSVILFLNVYANDCLLLLLAIKIVAHKYHFFFLSKGTIFSTFYFNTKQIF